MKRSPDHGEEISEENRYKHQQLTSDQRDFFGDN